MMKAAILLFLLLL